MPSHCPYLHHCPGKQSSSDASFRRLVSRLTYPTHQHLDPILTYPPSYQHHPPHWRITTQKHHDSIASLKELSHQVTQKSWSPRIICSRLSSLMSRRWVDSRSYPFHAHTETSPMTSFSQILFVPHQSNNPSISSKIIPLPHPTNHLNSLSQQSLPGSCFPCPCTSSVCGGETDKKQ